MWRPRTSRRSSAPSKVFPSFGPESVTPDQTIRDRMEMLLGVDDSVGQLLQVLEDRGELDNTVVVFTSDHGYFYGEHGLNAERRLAYEETARIPIVVRYPPLVEAGSTPEPFVLGDLAIHYEQRRVSVAGRLVHLTATEYDLLRILSVNAGRVLTYDSLVRQIWSGPDQGDPGLVRTFVKQLRRKLGGDPARPDYILNVRGVGYRLASLETP